MSECVLRFPARLDALADAFAELAQVLETQGLNGRGRYNVELVFEEVVTNIIRHGDIRRVDPEVEVALDFGPTAVVMSFRDDGVPFDLRKHVPSDDYASRLGGVGITLVRHAAATIDYERTAAQQNQLTVTVSTA